MTDGDKAIEAAVDEALEQGLSVDRRQLYAIMLDAIAAYKSAKNEGIIPVAWKRDDTLIVDYDHITWLREKMAMFPPPTEVA